MRRGIRSSRRFCVRLACVSRTERLGWPGKPLWMAGKRWKQQIDKTRRKMELLLDDRLAPITSEVGFLEAEINDVVSAYTQWMIPLQHPRGVTLVPQLGKAEG